MWTPTAPCHECSACARGLYNHCETLFKGIAMGAYADYILLPKHIVSQHVFHKPEHLPFAEAALMEPLACIFAAGGGWELFPTGSDFERSGAARRRYTSSRRAGPRAAASTACSSLASAPSACSTSRSRKRSAARKLPAVGGRESGLELAEQLGAHDVFQGHVPTVNDELKKAGLAEAGRRHRVHRQSAACGRKHRTLTRVGGKAMLSAA